jgi:hypothetical protein
LSVVSELISSSGLAMGKPLVFGVQYSVSAVNDTSNRKGRRLAASCPQGESQLSQAIDTSAGGNRAVMKESRCQSICSVGLGIAPALHTRHSLPETVALSHASQDRLDRDRCVICVR